MLKKVPWISMVLLVLAYGLFGWYLFQFTPYPITLVLVIGFLCVQAVILTFPPRRVLTRFMGWIMSSGTMLVLALTVVSIAVLLLLMVPALAHLLVGLAAAILLRLDLQVLGIRQSVTLVALILMGLLGLGSGWVVYATLRKPTVTAPKKNVPAPRTSLPASGEGKQDGPNSPATRDVEK